MLRAMLDIIRGRERAIPEHDEFGVDPHPSTEERLARLEIAHWVTLKERKRITLLQRSQLRAVGALVILVVVVGYLYGSHIATNTGKANDAVRKVRHAQQLAAAAIVRSNRRHDALRIYQIASCKRGNETRVIDNRSHKDDYLFDTSLVKLLRTALAQPEGANGLTPAQRRADRRNARQFTNQLAGFAKDKEWRYLIPNCEVAVDQPSKYISPKPIKFSTALPPYKALHIEHDPRRGINE